MVSPGATKELHRQHTSLSAHSIDKNSDYCRVNRAPRILATTQANTIGAFTQDMTTKTASDDLNAPISNANGVEPNAACASALAVFPARIRQSDQFYVVYSGAAATGQMRSKR